MGERHLIEEISRRYKAMPRTKRIAEIRALATRSRADDSFMRRTFPDLYREAFRIRRRRAVGARSESARQRKQAARRR